MRNISHKIVKNRKPHICDACSRKIDANINMHVHTNADEGSISNFRTCETCYELITKHSD